jgi:hypothetical protein
VGLLLGLAIYNGVILDVKLPLVLYKKLLGFGMPWNRSAMRLIHCTAIGCQLYHLLHSQVKLREIPNLACTVGNSAHCTSTLARCLWYYQRHWKAKDAQCFVINGRGSWIADPTIGDLKLAQPQLGQSLQQLLDWTDEQGDVEDIFCYTFQITQRLVRNALVDGVMNGKYWQMTHGVSCFFGPVARISTRHAGLKPHLPAFDVLQRLTSSDVARRSATVRRDTAD